MQLKLTVPALEKLAEGDDTFIPTLSHAAAKEIANKFSHLLIESDAVKSILSEVTKSLEKAKTEAGKVVEREMGEWDHRMIDGYRLRQKVVDYINQRFDQIVAARFEKWLKESDLDAKIDKYLKEHADRVLVKHLDQSLGDFLKRRF